MTRITLLTLTLLLANSASAAGLMGESAAHGWWAGLTSEYSEFGKEQQVLLAGGHAGWQVHDGMQGLSFGLYAKSSISEFTPISGMYNAVGITAEYLYESTMTGFFSGGANVGLSLAGDDTALHTEIFARYRVTVNNWLQAGLHAGYRLSPDHTSGQEMKGFNVGLLFNFGSF